MLLTSLILIYIIHQGKSSALKGFFANADKVGGNYPTGNVESSVVDIDPMDMSESMQEALHRSNLEMR